jgi:hypothetical protein
MFLHENHRTIDARVTFDLTHNWLQPIVAGVGVPAAARVNAATAWREYMWHVNHSALKVLINVVNRDVISMCVPTTYEATQSITLLFEAYDYILKILVLPTPTQRLNDKDSLALLARQWNGCGATLSALLRCADEKCFDDAHLQHLLIDISILCRNNTNYTGRKDFTSINLDPEVRVSLKNLAGALLIADRDAADTARCNAAQAAQAVAAAEAAAQAAAQAAGTQQPQQQQRQQQQRRQQQQQRPRQPAATTNAPTPVLGQFLHDQKTRCSLCGKVAKPDHHPGTATAATPTSPTFRRTPRPSPSAPLGSGLVPMAHPPFSSKQLAPLGRQTLRMSTIW